jgi:hypothetical protein
VFCPDRGAVILVERDGPLPLFADSVDWDVAQAELRERGLADGLPQVVPTVRRLDAMLVGVGEPELSLGLMPPMFGDLTPAAVAYCCVLAGCVPAELPLVLTAAVACLADDFNLLGLLTTTGTPAVAVMVSGPAVRELGLNSGTNTLGPGNRANACIGRALALVTRIIGGAVEGSGDMATMGQPGKYGFCFAEDAGGLLPSLPARRGLPSGASAVTVFGVSGTMEVPRSPRHAGGGADPCRRCHDRVRRGGEQRQGAGAWRASRPDPTGIADNTGQARLEGARNPKVSV